MVDRILQTAQESTYDFRKTACAHDPLKHRFEEWVLYYRLKWAIAKVLGPRRILEVGVRFGYSAMAFLDACPDAEYVGIDADLDTYGGSKGAIEWARQITNGYRAEFIVGDSQAMSTFPGGDYSLIHIDGQQDGDGTVHDFELAIRQAEWVLADGCYWTRDNFLALMECQLAMRPLVSYSVIIPGYAGELLVKSCDIEAVGDEATRRGYTRDYYLCVCPGHEEFKRTAGRTLEDPRARVVASLARLAPKGCALDLGCGRGEIALELGRQGFDVSAIDFSSDALRIAQSAMANESAAPLRCRFLKEDLREAIFSEGFALAIAADVVDQMTPIELDRLYARVARALSDDGLFIVRSSPNAWDMRYGHAKRRRSARSTGVYLPGNPRNWYERLMRVNEQSPRSLRRQLRRHFEHVLVWTVSCNCAEPAKGLLHRLPVSEMRNPADVMAVASHGPLDVERIAGVLRTDEMPVVARDCVRIEVPTPPSTLPSGSSTSIRVRLVNASGFELSSWPPHPVHLSYHWIECTTNRFSVFDGARTILWPVLQGRADWEYTMRVEAPLKSGGYILRATLVQEGVRWFDTPPIKAFVDVPVLIL